MAAQYGTVQATGLRSGMTYTKDVYFDDTAGNPARFDTGNGASATSPTQFQFPEPVIITDIVLAAATGQTKTLIARDGKPTGDILRNALHLASVTVRPALRIGLGARQVFTMVQLA